MRRKAALLGLADQMGGPALREFSRAAGGWCEWGKDYRKNPNDARIGEPLIEKSVQESGLERIVTWTSSS